MLDLVAFLDSRWARYLGCAPEQLRDGGRHIVPRPEVASAADSPWPVRRGPIAVFTTGRGWVMSLPEEMCERVRALCMDREFGDLVREGDRLQQQWFDRLDDEPTTGARDGDRGDRGYRLMNCLATEVRLRGWSHYLHWYCDPASFSPKRDEHVHPITEDQPEIWRQWQRWPGPMVGPRLQLRYETADAFGYVLNGRLVSAAQVQAASADFAWEYGVDTLSGYRCRGYATAVVQAATAFIIEQGRVPWYYHDHYNKASRRLPEKTGYFQYGEGLFSAE